MSAQLKVFEQTQTKKNSVSLFNFYVELRQEILKGIDCTTDNDSIQRNLKFLYKKYSQTASTFGFYIVKYHSDCGHPNHTKTSPEYEIESLLNQPISYKDPHYKCAGDIGHYSSRNRCPCSENFTTNKHYVWEKAIYDPAADQTICKNLYSIFRHIFWAITYAEEGRPKSGIRESLLEAVLKINDQILPIKIEDLIEIEKKKHAF